MPTRRSSRSSSSSQGDNGSPSGSASTSQSASATTHDGQAHCPFIGYDECHDGVGGRGYARTAIYRHMKDMHFPNEAAKETCRERIRTNMDCYNAWERMLTGMQLWLCIKCLHTHTWRKACRDPSHICEVINGPFNGSGADFLIHGATKPQRCTNHITGDGPESSKPNSGDDTLHITVEMLNTILQSQIPTIEKVELHPLLC
ncbi:uncharacterized protein LOC113342224 [Papaver somniferum]|uniref:uncharacterized protein LOC113342224 n=1 Tax=Papaver somniferum TaxID=3469 RepID=UPI000E6F9B4B|nr:uncharacterized protein LOC113342224 [Papaver somniferum]